MGTVTSLTTWPPASGLTMPLRSSTLPFVDESPPMKTVGDVGVLVSVGSGSNVVGTEVAPLTVAMLQKESVMSGVPPLVDGWPPPAHDADDIATVRLPKLEADSLVRSRTLGSPGCPVNVTPFAVPGWNVVPPGDP